MHYIQCVIRFILLGENVYESNISFGIGRDYCIWNFQHQYEANYIGKFVLRNNNSKTVSQNVIAFGFYVKSGINVCVYLQILVLLITGLSTLLQMKHHPIFLRITNDSLYILHNSFENVAVA